MQPNPWYRRTTPYTPSRVTEFTAHVSRTVPVGYAAFVAKGARLSQLGVNFLDASAVLDNEPNSIYSNEFGHYIPKGYDMLWLAIVKALAAPDLR